MIAGRGARAAGNGLSYIMWVYLLWNVPQFLLGCQLRGGVRRMFASAGTVAKGLLAGALALSAYCLVIEAFRYLPIATVSALRELSSIFAVLIGWLFLRERLTARRVVACALVTCGAVLIRL